MDENKADKLREIGYTIQKSCGMCIHGCFKLYTDFGECSEHDYDHKKHTGGAKGSNRPLSIYKYGSCKLFSFRGESEIHSEHFKEFYETKR